MTSSFPCGIISGNYFVLTCSCWGWACLTDLDWGRVNLSVLLWWTEFLPHGCNIDIFTEESGLAGWSSINEGANACRGWSSQISRFYHIWAANTHSYKSLKTWKIFTSWMSYVCFGEKRLWHAVIANAHVCLQNIKNETSFSRERLAKWTRTAYKYSLFLVIVVPVGTLAPVGPFDWETVQA